MNGENQSPIVPPVNNNGRPEYPEEQYESWLKELKPYLEMGSTLHFSMDRAGLLPHKNRIYQKYAEKGWFREKVDTLRSSVGDMINTALVSETIRITTLQKQGKVLSDEEVQTLRYMASNHRTAQPFFVSRVEKAEAKDKDFGKVVEPVNISMTTYQSTEKKDGQPAQPTNTNPANSV